MSHQKPHHKDVEGNSQAGDDCAQQAHSDDRVHRAELATAAEHQLTILQAMKLYPQATAWSICLSLGVIMDGLLICGIVTERYGYRKTMAGTLIYLTGIIFMFFFAVDLKMLVAAEILAGIPFGIFNILSVAYASEVAPLALRPFLTTWVNCCWGIGQLIALGTLRGFLGRNDDYGWKIPFALQWMWIPPLFAVAMLCPESPWWLVRQARSQEAKRSLERLISQKSGIDYNLDNMVAMMEETHNAEIAIRAGASYAECFRGTNLRRTEVVCMAWACQVFSGIVLFSVMSYFLQQAGLPSTVSFDFSMTNYAINIIGTFTAWGLTARGVGRRTIYVNGLAGMFCVLITIGGISTIGNQASSWATAVLLLFWTVCYQCTIGTICYAVAAEVPARKLLLKTMNLGRATYSISSIIANSVNPYMISPDAWNWKGKAAFFWAGTCFLSLIWAYFRLPEVKGLTFLEMDRMFEFKISARHSTKYTAEDFGKQQSEVNAAKDCLERDKPQVKHLENVESG